LGALSEFVRCRPVLGVCAGIILLAEEVSHPKQKSLAALPIAVERNSYGRQRDSFMASLEATAEWSGPAVEGVFIRAPRISRISGETRALMRYKGDTVFVEHRNVLATTFHPELTEQTALHEYFLHKCGKI